MIKKPIKAVTEFHNAFRLSVEYKPKSDISSEITELRYNLMKKRMKNTYKQLNQMI